MPIDPIAQLNIIRDTVMDTLHDDEGMPHAGITDTFASFGWDAAAMRPFVQKVLAKLHTPLGAFDEAAFDAQFADAHLYKSAGVLISDLDQHIVVT